MNINLRRDYLNRYGVRLWSVYMLCGLAKQVVGFRAFRGMTLALRDIDPKYLEEAAPFSHSRLTAREFGQLEGATELEGQAFYEAAAERGDWCHCMRHGEIIASYGWYATGPVPAVDDDDIGFSSEYVYMYKGFSLPEFRGRQLHAHGMAHATAEAESRGYQGLISFVEIQNEGSLRSVARLGYRSFGTCYRLRLFGRTLTFSTPGCKPFGFRLLLAGTSQERAPARDERALRPSSGALAAQDPAAP
jgi:GNAT superfamily N-acetyltransferase